MSIKREAAYHEAGHAVAAHHSTFHNIVGPINLMDYGAGEIYISLSKKKQLAKGKAAELSSTKAKDVAVSLAIVLAAGLVAEKIAAQRDPSIVPDIVCALPDHAVLQQNLADAGLSKKFNKHESTAANLLESEWLLVAALADYLLEKVSTTPDEVCLFIENYYNPPQ